MLDRVHDADFVDCGTKHTVRYSVDNKKKLFQITGRHYYDINEDGSTGTELKTVSPTNIELIGKQIALRSPVTCAGQKCVCATCYGRSLSEKNRGLNTGLNSVFLLTNPLTQRLLSAKHLLSTNTDKVDFGEEFNSAFVVNLDTICFDEDVETTITFKTPTFDDYDDEYDAYVIKELDINIGDLKKPIHYVSPVPLLLSSKVNFSEDEKEVTISSKSFTWEYVFKYVAKNNELTKSLENILNLIESSGHLGITDYNEFVNKFDDLLIENGMGGIMSVHAEMITSILIRDSETGKKLDFSAETLNTYEIVRVSNTVMRGPLSKSIAFERVGDQLADLSTYEKNEESNYDLLFK